MVCTCIIMHMLLLIVMYTRIRYSNVTWPCTLPPHAQVYDLTKEGDLCSLCTEIERQMRVSVQSGKTVTSQPISLTVYGPHLSISNLKRMVLVDLTEIVSVSVMWLCISVQIVTTGMAVNTREDIIKMCRCVVCGDCSVESVVRNSCSSTDSTCRTRTPSSCAYTR